MPRSVNWPGPPEAGAPVWAASSDAAAGAFSEGVHEVTEPTPIITPAARINKPTQVIDFFMTAPSIQHSTTL